MRITYIQNEESASLSVGEQPASERLFFDIEYNEVTPHIDGLNAIQSYQDGTVEVEWVDEKGCLGNSIGWNGLPVGFKETLVSLYEDLVAQKEEEEARLQAEAEAEDTDGEEVA